MMGGLWLKLVSFAISFALLSDVSTAQTVYTNKDTYTSSYNKNSNYGGSDELYTGKFKEYVFLILENFQIYTYVEFDLSSLANTTCFNSVQLFMAHDSGDYNGYSSASLSGAEFGFSYLNPSTWTEAGLTWNNQGSVQWLNLVDDKTWMASSGSYSYVNLNVANVQTSFNQFQAISFKVAAAVADTVYGLYSREGGMAAYVTINYTVCGSGYVCNLGQCSVEISTPTPTLTSMLTPTPNPTTSTSTYTPTPTPSSPSSLGSSSSNGGTIAGIIIAGLVLIALAVLLFFIYKRRHQTKKDQQVLSSKEDLNFSAPVTPTPASETASKRTSGYELNPMMMMAVNNTKEFGDGTKPPETTLANTGFDISLPEFLSLNYQTQVKKGQKIGDGRFAAVYQGDLLDEALQRKYGTSQVAIKMGIDDPTLNEEDNWLKFKEEIAVIWSLNTNSNVVALIGYCQKPKCIITKLYTTDLSKFIHEKLSKILTSEAFSIVSDIVKGMANIHVSGIAHRDLKSANILIETISTNGKIGTKASICDFGFARPKERKGAKLTKQDLFNPKGMSCRYTAPEVFSRFRAQTQPTIEDDFKADVYSFATVVWELLTSKIPWGNCGTAQEIEVAVLEGNREEIPKLTGDKSGEILTSLIGLCWAQNPAERLFFSSIVKSFP